MVVSTLELFPGVMMRQVVIVGSFLYCGPSVTFLNFIGPFEEDLPKCYSEGGGGACTLWLREVTWFALWNVC